MGWAVLGVNLGHPVVTSGIFCMRGSDALFPNDFGEDLLLLLSMPMVADASEGDQWLLLLLYVCQWVCLWVFMSLCVSVLQKEIILSCQHQNRICFWHGYACQ